LQPPEKGDGASVFGEPSVTAAARCAGAGPLRRSALLNSTTARSKQGVDEVNARFGHPAETDSRTLELEDFRNLFAVLETVAHAVGQEQFFDQFREGLARHLGWSDTVLVDIPQSHGAFPEKSALLDHLHSNRPADYLEEYVDRWYLQNPFKTSSAISLLGRSHPITLCDMYPHSTRAEWDFVDQYLHRHGIADVLNGTIDAGPEGGMLVCTYAADENLIRARERVLMKYLNRHVGPWLQAHFVRLRETQHQATLTLRERHVAELTAEGLTNAQIAARLHVTVDTVKKHLTHAMAKTKCANRTQLALLFSAKDAVRPRDRS
jgi:DNA-binding CsgD family transcriptional regulator